MRSHLDDEESEMGWQVSIHSRGNVFELWRSLQMQSIQDGYLAIEDTVK